MILMSRVHALRDPFIWRTDGHLPGHFREHATLSGWDAWQDRSADVDGAGRG